MNLIDEAIRYVTEAIGFAPEIKALPKTQKDKLPYFIIDAYNLHYGLLLQKKFILFSPVREQAYTPAEFARHADVIRKNLGTDVVLLISELTSYNRKRLIGHKVPFIVPGKQMYLPDLMIDVREHLRKVRDNKRDLLSPSAQAILFYCILHRKYSLFSNDLISVVPYSRMTLNRAFDELAYFELAEKSFPGRDKLLCFTVTGKELWEKALPLLRTPVKNKVYAEGRIVNNVKIRLAGLSALAAYSMISGEDVPVYAVDQDFYRRLKKDHQLEEVPDVAQASAIIEIWSYAPEILSDNNLIDPLSLYMSLRDDHNERIQGELESMMEDKVLW